MNNEIHIIKGILENEIYGLSLENQIILIIIETLLVFIPGVVLYFKKKITVKRLLHVYFIVLYAGIMLSFTIFRRPIGSRAGIFHLDISLGFDKNGIKNIWTSTLSFFNIALFVPWGILIYTLLKKNGFIIKIIKATFISLITSICIETTQFITATGMFEVTDMVTNTLGGLIGAMIIAGIMTV